MIKKKKKKTIFIDIIYEVRINNIQINNNSKIIIYIT